MTTVNLCDGRNCGECYRCRLDRLQREYDTLHDAVLRMRQAQRAYFQTRAISALRDAQAMERKVDSILNKHGSHGKATDAQQRFL